MCRAEDWCVQLMDIQSAILELFVPFSNILHFHCAVIMDASQMAVKYVSPKIPIHTANFVT
jgi:hypothetical protein